MGGVKCTKKLIQYIFLLKVLYFNTPLTFFFNRKTLRLLEFGHQDGVHNVFFIMVKTL